MEILASRRYTCEICGAKGRRSNAISERQRPPICPVCERYKSYQEYVQPSSMHVIKESSYKSLLVKYQDLVEQNKELEFRLYELRELSQAVVNRWETPLWKDTKRTAEYIYALRNHLNKLQNNTIYMDNK
jgi:hypothetical protein